MCDQTEYLIDFTGGGPLDGASRTYNRLPPEGEEILVTRRRRDQLRRGGSCRTPQRAKFHWGHRAGMDSSGMARG